MHARADRSASSRRIHRHFPQRGLAPDVSEVTRLAEPSNRRNLPTHLICWVRCLERKVFSMEYSLQLLPVGESLIPGPELFWMSAWDEWFPLRFQVALIRGNGVVALVNTGPARDLEPMNKQWESFLGPRARLARRDGEFILEQLERVGVRPEDVTHVFLTPLQLYSVSNIHEFPNAQIAMSRRGWEHFHTTKSHPHDDRDASLPPDVLAHLIGPAWERLRLLTDEEQIAEGLRTWWAGSHHRASFAVEVDTAQGTAVITDAFFYIENVERDHPIGICENIYEAMAAHARASNADLIIPLYDPKNLDRFPGGIVS